MNPSISIKRLYVFAIGFAGACITSLALDNYALLVLPVVVAFGYLIAVKPKYILYFLAFATPLSLNLFDAKDAALNLSIPTEPLTVLLLLGVVLKLLASNKLVVQEVRTILSILLISELVWMGVTTYTSVIPVVSFKYLLSRTWYLVVFYFLLTRFFRNEKHIKIFLWCLVSSTVILALYTLFQHSAGDFSRSYAYTAMRPFLPDHGMYGAALAFVAPVTFVFAWFGHKLNFSNFTRLISAVAFVVLLIAIYYSFTRAAWISIAAAAGIFGLLLVRIKFRYLILAGCLVVGGVLVNLDSIQTDLSRNKKESDDNIENHLQSVSNVTSDPSNMERLNRWSCVTRMVEDKPVFGFGPGTYTFAYGAYQIPHEMTIISTNSGSLGGVHSEYLRPLAESGFVGGALFLAIVIAAFSLGFKTYFSLEGSAKYLCLAAFLGLVTYFTHAFLNNYSDFDKIAVPLYSFMAVLTALSVQQKHGAKIPQK